MNVIFFEWDVGSCDSFDALRKVLCVFLKMISSFSATGTSFT